MTLRGETELTIQGLLWFQVPGDIDPREQVSPHFQAWELWRSEIASRQRIDNRPPKELLRQCVYTARTVLEPIREHFGIPFSPNSLFRCQELERALKGKPDDWVSRSQHVRGEAADIEIPSVPNLALAYWIAGHVIFDQLILECHDPAKGPNSGWVHVSREVTGTFTNRGEILSYVKGPHGNFVYVPGLVGT